MSIKKLAVVMIVISSVSYAQTGHYEWNALPFGGAGFVSGSKWALEDTLDPKSIFHHGSFSFLTRIRVIRGSKNI